MNSSLQSQKILTSWRIFSLTKECKDFQQQTPSHRMNPAPLSVWDWGVAWCSSSRFLWSRILTIGSFLAIVGKGILVMLGTFKCFSNSWLQLLDKYLIFAGGQRSRSYFRNPFLRSTLSRPSWMVPDQTLWTVHQMHWWKSVLQRELL